MTTVETTITGLLRQMNTKIDRLALDITDMKSRLVASERGLVEILRQLRANKPGLP